MIDTYMINHEDYNVYLDQKLWSVDGFNNVIPRMNDFGKIVQSYCINMNNRGKGDVLISQMRQQSGDFLTGKLAFPSFVESPYAQDLAKKANVQNLLLSAAPFLALYASDKAFGGGIPFTPQQQAVINLADEQRKGKGYVTADEAATLLEWADEYDVPYSRGPEQHPLRTPNSLPGPGQDWHIHIGPIRHLPMR